VGDAVEVHFVAPFALRCQIGQLVTRLDGWHALAVHASLTALCGYTL
jgi:hypothetical protein